MYRLELAIFVIYAAYFTSKMSGLVTNMGRYVVGFGR
jgi:hypothetical protein